MDSLYIPIKAERQNAFNHRETGLEQEAIILSRDYTTFSAYYKSMVQFTSFPIDG
jgi:hypothetical protein